VAIVTVTRTMLLMVILLIAKAAGAGRSVQDGIYSDAQAKRGEAIYVQYCAGCHGQQLKGDETSSALAGGVFTTKWNGSTVGGLAERIQNEMSLDQPGVLTRQQSAEVIAFILKTNGWPSGAADMPVDLAALQEIRIQATQP
jgi:mono/diheme cytochrome c family protein